MIIERINLNNWKIFRNPVEVEFNQGLNILHGPNESGKSTLIDAIRTAFFYKNGSRSQKITSLVPWESRLSPNVEITFQKNGEDYRISKSFIQSNSVIEKLSDGIWQKIAEGDNADQELIKIIGGNFPRSGDSKPEQWGLAQTLWMVQGQPIIKEDLNEETMSSLQSLMGAALESGKEREVIKKLTDLFLSSFTKSKRDYKSGSELKSLEIKIEELKDTLNQSKLSKVRKEVIIRQIDDNQILLQKKNHTLKDASLEKQKLSEEVQQVYEHIRIRENLERELVKLDSDYESLKEKIDLIKKGKQKIEEISSENEDLLNEKEILDLELKILQKNIINISTEMTENEDLIKEKLTEKKFAGIAHTAVMEEFELQEKREKLKIVKELSKELVESETQFSSLIAPTKTALSEIEKLNDEIIHLKTSLEAIGLTINVSSDPKISGEINLDGKLSSFDLNNNEIGSWSAHQSLKINIDNVGEILVKSGSQDVLQMRENLDETQNKYDKLVSPFSTQDIGELRDLLNQNNQLNDTIGRLKKDLKTQAKNGKESLLKEISELENRIKSNWNKIPDNSPFKDCKGKEDDLVRQELSKKITEIEDLIEELDLQKDQLKEKLEAEETQSDDKKTRIGEIDKEVHGNQQRSHEIEQSILNQEKDSLTQEERQNSLSLLSADLYQKQSALKVFENEMEEKENRPLRAFKEVEAKVERLKDEIKKIDIDINGRETELKMIISSTKDSNIIEEELETLKNNKDKLETEARAIELLYDLTGFYRENTVAELSEPIQKKVTELIEKLLGSKYCVNFDKMKPDCVDVGTAGIASIENLSFGTQEQIWCLFRLAMGDLLSNNEKQLVVLDDPLVNTDSVRMHHALEILEESTKNMQIVVVTCDVDKYNSLLDANFISLNGGSLTSD
ncbi:MAG: SMC family ATPase [Methanobacteriaceae archaeon]|nr:SMC family ATPase [Methanobacteriaceae archaeon]